MTLTLEIQPDLEGQLRQEAAREGLDTPGYVLRLLTDRLRRLAAPRPSRLDPAQANLLLKINEGLPEAAWRRYQALVERRRAESLTDEEHAELITLSDAIEEAHACRVGYLSELARLLDCRDCRGAQGNPRSAHSPPLRGARSGLGRSLVRVIRRS